MSITEQLSGGKEILTQYLIKPLRRSHYFKFTDAKLRPKEAKSLSQSHSENIGWHSG